VLFPWLDRNLACKSPVPRFALGGPPAGCTLQDRRYCALESELLSTAREDTIAAPRICAAGIADARPPDKLVIAHRQWWSPDDMSSWWKGSRVPVVPCLLSLTHSGSGGAVDSPSGRSYNIAGWHPLKQPHPMAEERVQRRLAAIRATGVVGYSRLMEEECRQWALASSIAVLSFTNFSGDPEQYFSDGIMEEDIITELSRCRQSFMIARNSSLESRRPTVNLADDRRRLGAVRIAAQLIGVRSA
jgi:hypothetical protein